MCRPLLFCFVVLSLPREISAPVSQKIIFWNVGQGSWTTLMTDKTCVHVDAGGRTISLNKECRSRKNYLWFTHYDWDHINQTQKILMAAPNTCLMQTPPQALKLFKKKFLAKIPLCEQKEALRFKKNPALIEPLHQPNFALKNESSVFLLGQKVLITGDASQKMEKAWLHKIPFNQVKILLAGHHGSRTSLSKNLLKNLSNLQMTIVSAEKKKYGHPHVETVEKLKRARIPLLSTEDFGSIAFEF